MASVGEYLAGGKEFLLREILLRDKLLQLMLKELLEVDVRLRPLQPLLAVLRHEQKDRSVCGNAWDWGAARGTHTPAWRLRTCPCGSQ